MKVHEILTNYSEQALDKISSDKLDEAVNLRLPRSIVVQEIIAALSSLSYVAKVLAPTKPPTYAFIKLLLEPPDYMVPVEGFQEKVLMATQNITQDTESGAGLTLEKNYSLYLNILKTAWEDGKIDRSEALLLESLRAELEILPREHLRMEHHPEINKIKDFPTEYVAIRNYLLKKGLVLTWDNNYIIAEEVAKQIRKAWGIDLENNNYKRMLSALSTQQLHQILDKTSLQVSGKKDERIERILNALIPPVETLNYLNIEELRDICRQLKTQSSGTKSEVIENIIGHFDQNKDLNNNEEPVEEVLPIKPEERELEDSLFSQLLEYLSTDQLYDILSTVSLKTSGLKTQKISRLIDSPWSERTILSHLRRIELASLCRKLNIRVSGVKNELLDRIIEWTTTKFHYNTAKALREDLYNQPEGQSLTGKNPQEEVATITDDSPNQEQLLNLHEIKKDFPGLEPDEQVILALIKETKSLTEQDIERTSRYHGFEWSLTKAHMAELLGKLKELSKIPIRIRSVSSVNIYEWIGIESDRNEDTEKRAAQNIIDALRQGVVPRNNLNLLAVGQENAREHLVELLEDIKQGNKSAFKFIRGPYGAGKSFLCSWLRQNALDKEYVTSTITIGPDQPLSDLPVFFTGVINGLRTPEKRDASALRDILESWLLKVHRKTAQIEGMMAFDQKTKDTLMPLVEKRIESELANIPANDPCFSSALRAFYHALLTDDQTTASTAIAWLSGSRSMPSRELNKIGVRGYLEANQVISRIKALLEVIRESRFKGLLLLVDELELVRKFPHARQREQAFETLRSLIDETGKNDFPGCLMVFTGTDTFFDDDRAGLKSYEALYNRVSSQAIPGGIISMRQPVIQLEGLNKERLLNVAKKIRNIHAIAYKWAAQDIVCDDYLEKFIEDLTAFGNESISRKPRPILRKLINRLDLFEENPGINLDEYLHYGNSEENIAKDIVDIFDE